MYDLTLFLFSVLFGLSILFITILITKNYELNKQIEKEIKTSKKFEELYSIFFDRYKKLFEIPISYFELARDELIRKFPEEIIGSYWRTQQYVYSITIFSKDKNTLETIENRIKDISEKQYEDNHSSRILIASLSMNKNSQKQKNRHICEYCDSVLENNKCLGCGKKYYDEYWTTTR